MFLKVLKVIHLFFKLLRSYGFDWSNDQANPWDLSLRGEDFHFVFIMFSKKSLCSLKYKVISSSTPLQRPPGTSRDL